MQRASQGIVTQHSSSGALAGLALTEHGTGRTPRQGLRKTAWEGGRAPGTCRGHLCLGSALARLGPCRVKTLLVGPGSLSSSKKKQQVNLKNKFVACIGDDLLKFLSARNSGHLGNGRPGGLEGRRGRAVFQRAWETHREKQRVDFRNCLHQSTLVTQFCFLRAFKVPTNT